MAAAKGLLGRFLLFPGAVAHDLQRRQRFLKSCVDGSGGCSVVRQFSVKELSWCAPAGSINPQQKKQQPQKDKKQASATKEEHQAADCKFGIVAAMSRNRVIGIRGGLPWNLPTDRQAFVNLTRNKILIIGRDTLHERPTLSHVNHAKATIVVSKTLAAAAAAEAQEEESGENTTALAADAARNDAERSESSKQQRHRLVFAASFDEGLRQAKRLAPASSEESTTLKNETVSNENSGSSKVTVDAPVVEPVPDALNSIDCWVAGGERLYQEALQHDMAQFLHLTVVDMDVVLPEQQQDQDGTTAAAVARFPAKYRWDHKFRLLKQGEVVQDGSVRYTPFLYQHIHRLRELAAQQQQRQT